MGCIEREEKDMLQREKVQSQLSAIIIEMFIGPSKQTKETGMECREEDVGIKIPARLVPRLHVSVLLG